MAYAGKFKLTQDFQFDIPNSGGKSSTIPKGAVVWGIVLTKDAPEGQAGGGTAYALGTEVDTPQGKVAVQIPINMVERHQSANDKVNYNWLYLVAAAGLVFWYVTRNKNKRERAMPAGYAGVS
jgi:hypothetical protein